MPSVIRTTLATPSPPCSQSQTLAIRALVRVSVSPNMQPNDNNEFRLLCVKVRAVSFIRTYRPPLVVERRLAQRLSRKDNTAQAGCADGWEEEFMAKGPQRA